MILNLTQLSFFFNIKESSQIKILDILVQGNTITKKRFILNSVSLKKGDILTPKKIELATNALRDLGLFSSIDFLIQDPPSDDVHQRQKAKSLIIQVKERKPRSLRFAVGVHTERVLTARGLTEFSHRNIGGVGRNIFSKLKLQSSIIKSTDLEDNFLEHQLDTSYVEPFLFNTKLSGQIHLSHSSQIFSELNPGIIDVVNSTQIDFLFRIKLLEFMNLTYSIFTWEGRREFEKTSQCSTLFFLVNTVCKNSTLNIASTGISFNVDKRNNILYPTAGFLSQVFFEYAGPLYFIETTEKIRFVKIEILKHI